MNRSILISTIVMASLLLTVACATGPEKSPEEGLVPKRIKNSIGMDFILIPSGVYKMGSPAEETDRFSDETLHVATLPDSIYMQTTEVTQAQWAAVMGNNPAKFKECGDNRPVEQVSWLDVQEFIRRLNQMEGADSYRLPTETEWEYAARAGGTTVFGNGDMTNAKCGPDTVLTAMGWYCGNSGEKTHPVGSKSPNAWGLYDMHGNVWEWCQDWYGPYPTNENSGFLILPLKWGRVVRGGSYISYAGLCRSAARGWQNPEKRVTHLGFRLVKTK